MDATKDIIFSEFKDGIEELYKRLSSEFESDIKDMISCKINFIEDPDLDSDKEDHTETVPEGGAAAAPILPSKAPRKQKDPEPFTAAGKVSKEKKFAAEIDGVERKYVYERSLWRNKFIAKQRIHYQEQCASRGIEYKAPMYNSLVNYYWKKECKNIAKEISESDDLVDLFEFYHKLNKANQNEMFAKNPYFHNFMGTS